MNVDLLIQSVNLRGRLEVPRGARGLIIFVYGGGSSRLSSGNIFLANKLFKVGYATLIFDLLTGDEDRWSVNKFEVDMLTERLIGVTKWCMENEITQGLSIGYFGTSTGSAAALSAAVYWGTKIEAVVSRGGRPDLAMDELDLIEAPVLLIAGGEDKEIIGLNRKAYIKIGCVKKMEIVLGASHLFEELGAMEKVSDLAISWFDKFLFNEVKEGVASVCQEDRPKKVAEKSRPQIANERNSIKATGKRYYLAAKLRNKSTKK